MGTSGALCWRHNLAPPARTPLALLPLCSSTQVGQLSIPQLPLTYRLSADQLGFIQMDYG